jgi:hypothetical protein
MVSLYICPYESSYPYGVNERTGQNHSSRISMIGLAPVMIAAKRPDV